MPAARAIVSRCVGAGSDAFIVRLFIIPTLDDNDHDNNCPCPMLVRLYEIQGAVRFSTYPPLTHGEGKWAASYT